MTRRELRESVLRILFQHDLGRIPVDLSLAREIEEHRPSGPEERFLRETVTGTCSRLKEIDSVISRHLQGWKMERIAAVDRNVLRIAAYELLYADDIPPRVSINEAVELAKKFGDDDSGRFVNGVLAGILSEIQGVPRQ